MEQPTTEQLAATLAAHGLPLLRTSEAAIPLALDPAALIEAMVRDREGRLAEALIALFLRYPVCAGYVPALGEQLPAPLARRLQHLYTAAVYLQQLWRSSLGIYLGPTPALPDYFGQRVWNLPNPDGHCGEASLRDLAEIMEAETGINWRSTYESGLALLMTCLRLQDAAGEIGTGTPPLLTAEAFWHLGETETPHVLVRGRVLDVELPGGQQGRIAAELSAQLRVWAKQGPGGCVGVSSGFVLARDPDTVRAPDVYYVGADRMPATGIPEGFWDLAPDLAVEVARLSDSAEEVRAKVHDYLQAGTVLVWVIDPRTREVVVHAPDGLARTYTEIDVLEEFTSLPGFACPVSSIFT